MPVSLHPFFQDDPEHRLVGIGRDQRIIDRLRSEYRLVRARGDEFARVFYDDLFARHPTVRVLLQTDPALQRAKLMDSLGTVIAFLDRPAEQAPYLTALGARLAHHGARAEDYPIVSTLLADAIVTVLGQNADEDTRADWLELFGLVAAGMLAGTR